MSDFSSVELSFNAIFKKLDEHRYLFDVRKIFDFADGVDCELVTPQ